MARLHTPFFFSFVPLQVLAERPCRHDLSVGHHTPGIVLRSTAAVSVSSAVVCAVNGMEVPPEAVMSRG